MSNRLQCHSGYLKMNQQACCIQLHLCKLFSILQTYIPHAVSTASLFEPHCVCDISLGLYHPLCSLCDLCFLQVFSPDPHTHSSEFRCGMTVVVQFDGGSFEPSDPMCGLSSIELHDQSGNNFPLEKHGVCTPLHHAAPSPFVSATVLVVTCIIHLACLYTDFLALPFLLLLSLLRTIPTLFHFCWKFVSILSNDSNTLHA